MYYELLKHGEKETVNTRRYQQSLTDLNHFDLKKGQNTERCIIKSHFFTAMPHYIRKNLEAPSWEVLPHVVYSPDLTPSDYHLFASMRHAVAEQPFGSYVDVKKWLDEWFAAKEVRFLPAYYSQIAGKIEKIYNK